MTVESASFISQLDTALPASGDAKSEGDNHLRIIKAAVKGSFPNLGAIAVTTTGAQLNTVPELAPKASPAFTGTPTAPTVATTDSSATLATTALVSAKITAAALSISVPVVPSDAGKYLTNNGAISSWAGIGINLSSRTANTALSNSDTSSLIDITSGTFTQTFAACATLGGGWYCYLKNSGTGDITLDPNASETIDGLTGFVMYPGECRLIQCDGSALRSVVVNSFYKTFTASGTFIKPPGYAAFEGVLWGAGGAGFAGGGPGGGGGACASFRCLTVNLSSAETVTVGAGGTSSFSAGGTTTFKDTQAFGGFCSNTVSRGGGLLSAADNTIAGAPQLSGASQIYGGANTTTDSVIFGGGACGGSASIGGDSLWGGAAGGGSAGRVGGSSKYGGSGGAGGAVGINGTAPGGGGGAGTSTAGAGARGELRIWGVI